MSWKNPDASYRDFALDDYVEKGFLTAVEQAKAITGEDQVNTVGYCIAGTTLSLTLALLEKRGDTSIKSATMTNAELFQQEDEIGQLKEGFKADLIVVRGNPLKDIGVLEQEGAHIPLVMRDGKIFKDEPLVA